MEAKERCKPFDGMWTVLRTATKLTWFEKFCLFFIKPVIQVDEVERIRTVYKTFRGKLYIIDQSFLAPQQFNCRHQWQQNN